MRHTLLLFDVDLTLVDAGGAGQMAMKSAGRRVCGESFSFEGVSFAGRLDPLIFADALVHCPGLKVEDHHDDFRAVYAEHLRELVHGNGHRIRALPGVRPLVEGLSRRAEQRGDVMLGLLTGNYAETAKIKIEAAGLKRDWFTLGCFGDEAVSRPGLVELALRRYESLAGGASDPSRVIVIGDTPHDVGCAKAHGCVAFAVATGRTPANELRDAGADVVVADLADPEPLLSFLS